MNSDCNVGRTEWERLSDVESGWSVVEDRRKQKVLLVFGVKDSISLVEFKIACGDIGLNWLVSRAFIRRVGNRIVRISVNKKLARFFNHEYVCRLSRRMRVSYGWRCVYDELCADVNNVNKTRDSIKLSNRYSVLQHDSSIEHGRALERLDPSPICEVSESSKCMTKMKHRGLRIGTWNFQGLCSGRKALEIGEVLAKNRIDIVGGQESWELGSSKIYVPGYKWFGKPRESIKGKRGEGGVGFLISEPLLDDVTIIKNVKCTETIWLRIRIRKRVDLYIGCVYLPTQGNVKRICADRFNLLEEDVCMFQSKGRVLLLGDFNARVGKSIVEDSVIGMFGEASCNSNGKLLIELLENCNLMICNGRTKLNDPQWTRVQTRLGHKSIIDYLITDKALMNESSNVFVDRTDIGSSDHYLVWFELGRNFTKSRKKARRILYKWRIDRLQDKEIRDEYQVELGLQACDFFETLDDLNREKVVEEELVRRMASKWEKVVEKAALKALGRKLIVCGRSVNWWDEELRQLVKDRRACFSRGIGSDNNWKEYLIIRKELKQKIREKKKTCREELMAKVNSNYRKNIKAFWKFVNGSIKSSAKNKIETLTDDSGNSYSSHAGKVKILKSHYKKLGTELDVKSFDDSWKEEVSNSVKNFEALSFQDSHSNGILDQPITLAEVSHVVKAIKNNKSAGSDGIVGELIKYGGEPMCEMLLTLFNLSWDKEHAPSFWREGLIVSLFKKGDKEDPGNYRGITLLNVVGKLYSRVINNRLLKHLELNHMLHEGQGGFRVGRSCIDNIFSLNELIQGRIKEGKSTYAFFLDVKKAYDTVWRDGLWYKMWEMGIKGKMWRIVRSLYANNRSCIFLEGKCSDFFPVNQGVAQGCTLSPTLFLIYINGLLNEIEKCPELGAKFSENKMSGLLFADDFVGIAETGQALQSLIDVVHNYSKRWRFEANVKKCAVVVFSKTGTSSGKWVWGGESLPILESYCYLGVEFSSDGSWDKHIKSLIVRNRQKLGGLYRVLHNFALDLRTRRHILMAVLRPSLEYGCEVWNANKCQAKALESIQLRACKYILGCSVTTCDEPVLADLGLETLKYRRDFRKLKWYYKVKRMTDERLPFKLLANEWDTVKTRGRPRKCWVARVNSLKKELNLQDKILELKQVKEALVKRECEKFEMALQHKSKLRVYKELTRGVGYEEYLKHVKGPSSRLFFKFRSGTHGLFEELGRHTKRDGSQECPNCGACKESVEHVLFECASYDSQRQKFFGYMKQILTPEAFDVFIDSSIFDKAVFCLGEKQDMLINDEDSSWYNEIGDFLMSVWERRKEILYGNGPPIEVSQNNPTPECEVNGTRCYDG